VICLVFVWASVGCARGRGRDDFGKKKDVEKEAAKAEEAKKAEKKASPKEEKPKKPGFSGIEIDIENKNVTATGKVCLTKGILEYVVVATGGKEYESVFSMDAKPSHLHAALLMVGGLPGKIAREYMGDDKSKAAKKAKQQEASRFDVTIKWVDDGKKVSFPADRFLLNREKKETARDLEWAFTGSMFYKLDDGKERYLADEDGSIVATYYDDGAILNLARETKDPYRGESFGFSVNEKKIPPKGTTVLIIFQLKKKK
jgi:hypothetical protein